MALKPLDVLLSPARAAAYANTCRSTIRNAILAGELPAYVVERGGSEPSYALRKKDLDEWALRRTNPVTVVRRSIDAQIVGIKDVGQTRQELTIKVRGEEFKCIMESRYNIR